MKRVLLALAAVFAFGSGAAMADPPQIKPSAAVALLPKAVGGGAYDVQTTANANFPHAGTSGNTIPNGVLISFYAAHADGTPVTDLGADVGDGSSLIAMPPRVTLIDRVVPAGGCTIQATQFTNWGDGYYNLRAAPNRTNPSAPCAWLAGQYDYYVVVKSPGGAVAGAALGTFKVQ